MYTIVIVLCQTCIGNDSVGYASVIVHWKINWISRVRWV